jgi:ubiquitin C-terminal hydrolase
MYVNRKAVMERKSLKGMKLPGHRYCDVMAKLCGDVVSGDFTIIKATALRRITSSDFQITEQHDANEFIIHLFDKLQDEQTPKYAKFNSEGYSHGVEAWQAYESMHQSIIDQLFTGMCETRIRCSKCKHVTIVYD